MKQLSLFCHAGEERERYLTFTVQSFNETPANTRKEFRHIKRISNGTKCLMFAEISGTAVNK